MERIEMARNKYPGVCYRCNKIVVKGEGHFEKTKDGWRVQHADCCIKAKELIKPTTSGEN